MEQEWVYSILLILEHNMLQLQLDHFIRNDMLISSKIILAISQLSYSLNFIHENSSNFGLNYLFYTNVLKTGLD